MKKIGKKIKFCKELCKKLNLPFSKENNIKSYSRYKEESNKRNLIFR